MSFQQKSRCILVFKNMPFYFRRAVEARYDWPVKFVRISSAGRSGARLLSSYLEAGVVEWLEGGIPGVIVLRRSGVRAKFDVNMVNTEESEFSKLVKEERTGPGWKHSRQKLPRQTVVG